jgi:hypothetical protein
MRIVFKGGAVVDCDVDSFKTASSPITGQVTELTWKTADSPQVKPVDINVDQVAAVYAVHEVTP